MMLNEVVHPSHVPYLCHGRLGFTKSVAHSPCFAHHNIVQKTYVSSELWNVDFNIESDPKFNSAHLKEFRGSKTELKR